MNVSEINYRYLPDIVDRLPYCDANNHLRINRLNNPETDPGLFGLEGRAERVAVIFLITIGVITVIPAISILLFNGINKLYASLNKNNDINQSIRQLNNGLPFYLQEDVGYLGSAARYKVSRFRALPYEPHARYRYSRCARCCHDIRYAIVEHGPQQIIQPLPQAAAPRSRRRG